MICCNQTKVIWALIIATFVISCECFVPSCSRSAFLSATNMRSSIPLFSSEADDPTPEAGSATIVESAPVTEKPFAVIVKAEIQPDRMAEFLKLIETNAIETRKEPGCIRFDVLRCQEAPNQFFFYELYKNVDAIDYHKKQDHYNLWATFKASGGTIDSVTYKTDGEFLP